MKKLLNPLLVAIALCAIALVSCSSPKSDGEDLAQEECEAWDTYVKNTIGVYNTFISQFGSQHYQSRVQAREELNRRIDEVEEQLAARLDEIEGKFSAYFDKYSNDQDKYIALCNAYQNKVNAYDIDTTQFAPLRKQAQEKILTIIPREPDQAKIEEDLIGRVIRALPGGYFSDFWSWKISRGEIKQFQIVDVKNIDANNKEYFVEMILQENGAAYKVNGKIYYYLGDGDDWKIDMLEPSEVEIVKTGRYNSSVETQFYSLIIGRQISFRNISDAALIVGFSIIDSYGNRTKHSIVVPGGGTESYSTLGMMDYTIDFVERP